MKRILVLRQRQQLPQPNGGRIPAATVAANEAVVYSAGVEINGINPRAVQTMKEDGIDISHHMSNNMKEYKNIDFDFVITVCDHAKERCLFFPMNLKYVQLIILASVFAGQSLAEHLYPQRREINEWKAERFNLGIGLLNVALTFIPAVFLFNGSNFCKHTTWGCCIKFTFHFG